MSGLWVMTLVPEAAGIPMPRDGVDFVLVDGAEAIVVARTQHIEPVDSRTFTALMEQLQEAYVASVAATAGCTVEKVVRDVWGFDALIVRPPAQIGGEETQIAVQLKNTTRIKPDSNREFFSFTFKERRYFDALALKRKGNKAICIVMATPRQQANWTAATHDALSVHHCCYWANLEGYEVDAKTQSPTVRVPTANIFDAAALQAMMDRAEKGEAL